jgi:hypothetical protein
MTDNSSGYALHPLYDQRMIVARQTQMDKMALPLQVCTRLSLVRKYLSQSFFQVFQHPVNTLVACLEADHALSEFPYLSINCTVQRSKLLKEVLPPMKVITHLVISHIDPLAK